MPSRSHHGCLLIALPVAAGLLGTIDTASAAQGQKHVLVLYSTSRDSPMSLAGDRELPRILEEALEEDVSFFAEYIDQGRFPSLGYRAAFRNFLLVKYKGQPIDLIIAVQAAAIDFVGNYRDETFPGTPVVFLSLARDTQRIPNSTGVIADLHLASTLDLALALQPDVRNVFVVSGAGVPDRGYEREARAQLKPFENRLTITYLAGLATKDLEARLAALPERSIVYYLVVYQDGAGEAFAPMMYADRISAAARAPTYSWSDALIDHGIVGGSLLDRPAMMAAVAQTAVRVLKGEPADGIAVTSPDLHVRHVDWRQLRRWGINERRVPAGTQIHFRQPTAWDTYKVYIIGVVAIVLLQAGLISGLLVQGRRRRRAEQQVLGSQAALRASYDRIRDLGSRLLTAQEGERARIARELHDDISQQLALLTMDLEVLAGSAENEGEQLAHESLSRVHGIAKSVHDLSHRLHPTKLRLIGLVAALQSLEREVTRAGMAVTFTHDNVPASLPPELTLCLYRIVQEALQNALRYSNARIVAVQLTGGPEGLSLTIADDGVGFDVDARYGKGLGLISMHERLEAVGGTLEIRSKPGAGTRLEVKAPLAAGQLLQPSVRRADFA